MCFIWSDENFLPHSSFPTHMSTEQVTRRKARKDCKYTAEERKVIDLYKEEFRSETTKAGRVLILRSKILPAIFNYWVQNGTPPKDEDDSRQCARVTFHIICKYALINLTCNADSVIIRT
jgi:hypothetical protein